MKAIGIEAVADGRTVLERGDILLFGNRGPRLPGGSSGAPAEMLPEFSRVTLEFMKNVLPEYAGHWSAEPAQAHSAAADGQIAFRLLPGRALFGSLVLRCFVNVDPVRKEEWRTADPFAKLARREAENAGLRAYANAATSSLHQLKRRATRYLERLGNHVHDESAFDGFMGHFGEWMRQNSAWRARGLEYEFEFPPGTTWMAFTDVVPYGVTQAGTVLEQAVIVPREALANPMMAPASIVERIAGVRLTD